MSVSSAWHSLWMHSQAASHSLLTIWGEPPTVGSPTAPTGLGGVRERRRLRPGEGMGGRAPARSFRASIR